MWRAALIIGILLTTKVHADPCPRFTEGLLKEMELDANPEKSGCHTDRQSRTTRVVSSPERRRQVFVSTNPLEWTVRQEDLFGETQELKYTLNDRCEVTKIVASDAGQGIKAVSLDQDICTKAKQLGLQEIQSDPAAIRKAMQVSLSENAFFKIRMLCAKLPEPPSPVTPKRPASIR